jgi:hypothetical protein
VLAAAPLSDLRSPHRRRTVFETPTELLGDASRWLRRGGAAAAAAGAQSGGSRGGAASAEAAVLLASVAVAAAFEPVLLCRNLHDPSDPALAAAPLDFADAAAKAEPSAALGLGAARGTPPSMPPLPVAPPPAPPGGGAPVWALAESRRAAAHGVAAAAALGEPLLHLEALVVDAEVWQARRAMFSWLALARNIS